MVRIREVASARVMMCFWWSWMLVVVLGVLMKVSCDSGAGPHKLLC